MTTNLAAIRQEYTKGGLREGDLPDNPLFLFNQWLHEAIQAEADEPTAMLVGTVSPEGIPSTRTVLLKDLHDGKFVFYSNIREPQRTPPVAKPAHLALLRLAQAGKASARGRHRQPDFARSIGCLLPLAPLQKPHRGAHLPAKPAPLQPCPANAQVCKRGRPLDRERSGTPRLLGWICRHPRPHRVLARTSRSPARPLSLYAAGRRHVAPPAVGPVKFRQ